MFCDIKICKLTSTQESEEERQTRRWITDKKWARSCHVVVTTLGTNEYTVQEVFTCNIAYFFSQCENFSLKENHMFLKKIKWELCLNGIEVK